MKKKFMTVAAVGLALSLMFSVGLTGCGSSDEEVVDDAVDAVEEQADAVEDAVEDAIEDDAAAVQEDVDAAQNDVANAAEEQMISKKKAKKIARKDAGLSKAEIDFTNIHLDYDDGRTEYEIDFHKGITEYEYTIDAYTGDILEKSVDSDVD